MEDDKNTNRFKRERRQDCRNLQISKQFKDERGSN